MAWLVSQGVDPGRIMLLTFTRMASDEMLRRARVSELRRLKQLEEENRRLKGLVADLTLDKHILQEVLRKKP